MELAEQLAAYDRLAQEAFDRLVARLAAPGARERLVALGREGVVAGHAKYGDASWRKPPQGLARDVDEELRDALVYLVIALWRE